MNFKIELPKFKNKQYNILDFGAKVSTKFNNKSAIQQAIDTCSQNGGGMVIIPNGYFLSGPIELKSNVNLHLENNAFLQFTKSKEEYPLIWTDYEGQRRIRAISPITADHQNNIAITGHGVIDGNGVLWRGIKRMKLTEKEFQRCLKKSPYFQETKEGGIWYPTHTVYEGVQVGEPDYNDPNALEFASKYYDMYRPVLLSLKHCDKILIEDITIQNSPAWNIHPWFCSNFTLKNAKVKNKYSAQNGDGLDLESCKNCEIVGTVFEVGDDGICIKSGKNAEARAIEGPCENVWIHDCKVFDAHGGFVVGSEMSRGVHNLLVENCTFIGTDIGVRFKSAMGRGGVVEDITIRNNHIANILEEAFIFTMGYVLKNLETDKTD
ncbi:MAG: glycoside hydrolase family 28 protein, partial [Anaeroplasmataceae bacterium]|nr:glycoside hydrolase family 28 protein [Anaeroplasmataceae bacterium]